jgi:hypothetical protein
MATEIFYELQETSDELFRLLASFNQEKINSVPFQNSWTPAQIAEHVKRSNKSITLALSIEGKTPKRDPGEGIHKLKAMFLDFTVKFQSPEFILPTQDYYQKEILLKELKKSTARLHELAGEVNLSEEISLHPFGEITKLELLHFVLYHTQRHIHQVKNIFLIKEKDFA